MLKRYKLWIILSLAVVFGLGIAAGVFGERYLVHRSPRREAQQRTPFPLLEPVAKALQLTAVQQDKIRDIFKMNDDRMKVFQSEVHARLNEVRALLKGQVDGVLSPEQRQKLEAMIQKHIEESRSRSDRNERNERNPQGNEQTRPQGTK